MANGLRLEKDVVKEILLRLPVRSLTRIRCASKYWCALINNPTFVNDHHLQCQRSRSMLMVRRILPPPRDDDVLSFYDLHSAELEKEVWPQLHIPFLKDLRFKYDYSYWTPGVRVLGCCSGLICITYYNECIIFCNPALREFRRIPRCPFACPVAYSVSVLGEGFGNTRDNNDFKFVLIQSVNPDDYHALESYITVYLYTSSTDSWRQIEDAGIVIPWVSEFSCSELFFKGACHWNADTNGPGITDCILTFDVNNEAFTKFEYPDCLKDLDDNISCLMALNDKLALVRYYEYELAEEDHLIEVWVMKEYSIKESWTKQFLVGPQTIVCPFLFWRNNEHLLVECRYGELASFALSTSDIKKFDVKGVEATLRALVYEESLISVNKVEQVKASHEESANNG